MSLRATQLELVKKALSSTINGNAGWWTLNGLQKYLQSNGVGASETGVSARVRDLRKTAFGGHTIVRRQTAWAQNVYEYRMAA